MGRGRNKRKLQEWLEKLDNKPLSDRKLPTTIKKQKTAKKPATARKPRPTTRKVLLPTPTATPPTTTKQTTEKTTTDKKHETEIRRTKFELLQRHKELDELIQRQEERTRARLERQQQGQKWRA